MKKDRIFVYVFVGLFVLYVVLDFMAPKPIDWKVTYGANDKNPFGAYILNDRSADFFDNGLNLSRLTLSELSEANEENILILADQVNIERADLDNLWQILEKGGNVLIGGASFNSKLKDTLKFDSHFEYHFLNQNIFEAPETTISLFDSSRYSYPSTLVSNYFEIEDEEEWKVLASINEGPIAITKAVGEGVLTLVSTPGLFTNFGLLFDDNYPASAMLLSQLPQKNVHYTMFYHSGKGEPQTPLRYFLSVAPLRWSLYLGVLIILVFMVISSRRKQRAIPVVRPPKNATVKYVKTLGALFYRERDHKNAAMKLVNHFFQQVKEKYYVRIEFNEKFYQLFASKANVDREHVIKTFELIQSVKAQPQIEEKVLIDLSRKIERFK